MSYLRLSQEFPGTINTLLDTCNPENVTRVFDDGSVGSAEFKVSEIPRSIRDGIARPLLPLRSYEIRVAREHYGPLTCDASVSFNRIEQIEQGEVKFERENTVTYYADRQGAVTKFGKLCLQFGVGYQTDPELAAKHEALFESISTGCLFTEATNDEGILAWMQQTMEMQQAYGHGHVRESEIAAAQSFLRHLLDLPPTPGGA